MVMPNSSALALRRLTVEDMPLLEDFLYLAIHVPAGVEPPPRSIIENPELQIYIDGFGDDEADFGIVAEADGEPVGAAWARIMDDYGHIADDIPSVAISVKPDWRGQGIGTALLRALAEAVAQAGYTQLSLSVQKDNDAYRLYRRLGFFTVEETEDEYLMLASLPLS